MSRILACNGVNGFEKVLMGMPSYSPKLKEGYRFSMLMYPKQAATFSCRSQCLDTKMDIENPVHFR